MSKPIIKKLLALNEQFYWMCFHANVGSEAHPFLEFNGLMHKYIECLAKSGVDPQQANVHGGEAFPVKDHDLEYLGEKLACIFTPMIAANPRAREILSRHLFPEPVATKQPICECGATEYMEGSFATYCSEGHTNDEETAPPL